jgi:hypothetical protein
MDMIKIFAHVGQKSISDGWTRTADAGRAFGLVFFQPVTIK